MRKTVVGYTDRISVAPGETVDIKVSVETEGANYDTSVVRLLCTDSHAEGPGIIEHPTGADCDGRRQGRCQPIHAGSYASIPDLPPFGSFTMQAYVWPTRFDGVWQTVMGRADDEKHAVLLGLDRHGRAALQLDAETVSTETPLREREWVLIAASYDGEKGIAQVWQIPVRPMAGPRIQSHAQKTVSLNHASPRGRFSLAAHGPGHGAMTGHFNGKVDRPRLASRTLSESDVVALASDKVPSAIRGDVIAAWDFAAETATDRVVDISGHGHHGQVINLPARAMTGHNWSGDVFDWRHAPEQYGAIHFHDDDIYDAGWQTDFSWTVPDGTPSGVYAAKLDDGGAPDHVVFWVRPPRGQATSDICFLASTATYMAYGNYRVMDCSPTYEAFQGALLVAGPEDLFLSDHPEYGGSLYEIHADGSGVCTSSRLRPLVSMRPDTPLWQFAGDGYLTWWLDRLGYRADVVTDEDLHLEGLDLIAPYSVVVTGNHPEYWSTAMWDAVEAWLDRGGRFMYLGGNGFYWRIAYSEHFPGAIEVRRAEDGCRAWEAEPGEAHLAFSGEMSGMWRRVGRTPNSLVGVGMTAQGFDRGTYYIRRPDSDDSRAAWMFDGVRKDERIGDFGFAGGGASGQEIDRHDPTLGSPPHSLVLATSEGHNDNMLLVPEEYRATHLMLGGTENEKVRSDMVFFETSGGGAVFSTGSISWISSLAWNDGDNNVSRITQNVLDRFRDAEPFVMPSSS